MRTSVLRRRIDPLPSCLAALAVAGTFAAGTFAAQPALAQPDPFQGRIDAAAQALGKYPRYKGLSPEYREVIAEFMAGNTLFVLLHGMAHAATAQMQLPAADTREDAANSFAVTQLVKMGSAFPDRVLQDAAKGWFLSDHRNEENGDPIAYYDEHGIGAERAERIACLMVGTGEAKYQHLAAQTRLPKERQDGCAADFTAASNAWDAALKAHLRGPNQPKTKIDVVYGDAQGKLEGIAQGLRAMAVLETVAAQMADTYAWPAPFTIEAESCGFPNAQWLPRAGKLTLCYELAAEFGDLYRGYGDRPASGATRKVRAH